MGQELWLASGPQAVTLEPDGAQGRGRDRLPWHRAAVVLALLSVAGWLVILLLIRWLLG